MDSKFKVNLIVADQEDPLIFELTQDSTLDVNIWQLEELRQDAITFDEQSRVGINILSPSNELRLKLDQGWLLQLPMHRSVYLRDELADEIKPLLMALDTVDYSGIGIEHFSQHLQQDFFWGQQSSRILPLTPVQISDQFIGQVDWQGSSALVLNGQFSCSKSNVQRIVTFSEQAIVVDQFKKNYYFSNLLVHAGYWYRIQPIIVLDKDISWTLTITFIAPDQTVYATTLTADQPLVHVPSIKALGTDFSFYSLNLNLSGEGQAVIYGIDVTLARVSGKLLPGDTIIELPRGDSVSAYYNRPHLNRQPHRLVVVFAGYRAFNQRFEMPEVLEKLGEPFLLFTDSRAHGGAFYMNRFKTTKYEQTISQLITEKAKLLGFTMQEVVLVGLSMGSTAALYYGAKLNVGEVFVMKPIVNLGDFTSQPDLALDEGVAWMFEARRFITGRVDFADQDYLNNLVLAAIENNAGQTIFNIYALLEDQYDGRSIGPLITLLERKNQLGEYFWEHGRHTEKTDQAMNWWLGLMDELLMEGEN